MTDSELLQTLRRLLLALGAAVFGGTLVELIFAEHTDGLVQLVPIVCCLAGLATICLVWISPGARVLRAARVLMGIVLAASLFGVYEHLRSAYEMTRDFHPGMSGIDLWKTTVTSSIPILAPGALAAGAAVVLIGTWRLRPITARATSPSTRALSRT